MADIAMAPPLEQLSQPVGGLPVRRAKIVQKRIARRPAIIRRAQDGNLPAAIQRGENAFRSVASPRCGNQFHRFVAWHAKRDKCIYRRVANDADDGGEIAKPIGCPNRVHKTGEC